MKGASFSNGASVCNGPWSPAQRYKRGMPPPPVTSWTLTGWADPEDVQ